MGLATAWGRVQAALREGGDDDPETSRLLEAAHATRFQGRARWILRATFLVFLVSVLFVDGKVFSRADTLAIRVPEIVGSLACLWYLRRPRALLALELMMLAQWTVIAAMSSFGFTRIPTEMLGPKVVSLVVSVLLVQLVAGMRWRANLATALIAFFALLPLLFVGAARVFTLAITAGGFSSILLVVYSMGRARMERSELSARRALEVANERLRTEDELRRRLFTNLAHDFRTPLAIIGGEAALLRATLDAKGSGAAALVRVERNAASLADLTEQLLDLARLEAGQLPVRRVACDLGAVARDVAAQLAPVGSASIEVRADGPVVALADPKHVGRVVTNLVANALRQKREDGAPCQVVIATSREKERAIVDVVDDGQGIPAERREAIFRRFVSFDRDGNTASGIGLPLARELARLNGGELALHRDRPTTFRLELEATDEAPVPHESTASSALPGGEPSGTTSPREPSGRRPVLVVEDNADMRSVLERALGGAFVVESFPDVTTTRERLRGTPVAAVVSDVMLPDGSGYDVLAAVRGLRAWEGVPVVLVSALGRPEERVRGLAAGADDYLAKPFDPSELVRRVGSAVERAEGFAKKLEVQRDTLLMEVHDGVSASLARASLILSERAARAENVDADGSVGHACDAIRDGLEEVRAIPRLLSPRPVRFGELAAEIRRATAEACAAARLELEMSVEELDAEDAPLSAAAAHVIRRASREATTNAIKHAKAKRLRCRLVARDGSLRLRVEDDGVGFPATPTDGQGQGILRRRAARAGGAVETGNLEAGGAFVDVRVPRG